MAHACSDAIEAVRVNWREYVLHVGASVMDG